MMKTTIGFILSLLLFAYGLNASDEIVIREIPPAGITLSTPGTYVFENDLTWSPTGNGQAILIASKDVTLNMKGYKLISVPTPFYTTGVVALLSENLTIKNGTIQNMAYRGIDCTACSNILIEHITVDGLNIENTVDYTVPVGILVTASGTVFVNKCHVRNINVRTGSCAGIQMTSAINSRVWHCKIGNLLNRDGVCSGIGHLLCDLVDIKSCEIDGIKSEFIDNLNTAGHTAIGIIPFLSKEIWIRNCKVSNVVGCCDDAHGISVFECTNAAVKRCKVFSVLDGAGPEQTGAKATGIEIYGSDIEVEKCSVNYVYAINPQNRQSTGFSVAEGSRIKFIDCRAKNIKVVNELGIPDTSKGYGTGFGWAPDPRIIQPAVNVLYSNCTAKYCQVGFDSWFHIDSIWNDIYSKCNEIPVFNLGDEAQRTLSCDACSECGCTFVGCAPAPFSITINNIARNNVFQKVKIKNCRP